MSGKTPTISPEHLAIIYRQARAEFPRECCGYILGEGASAELVTCTNMQDKMHALDPDAFPRTSENGYMIGGKQLLRLSASVGSEQPVRIIYHSHPRVGAYFSEEDTRAAVATHWAVDYLVVDAQDDHIKEAVLFRRRGDDVHYEAIARFDGAKI